METWIILVIGVLAGGLIGRLAYDNRRLRRAVRYQGSRTTHWMTEAEAAKVALAEVTAENLTMHQVAQERERELAEARRALLVQVALRKGVSPWDDAHVLVD